MKLTSLGTIKELLSRHGFEFSKALGQNFLIAPHVPERIADGARLGSDCFVFEVGPGIGTLTRELATRAGSVCALELDHRLIPILEETTSDLGNVRIVQGDILSCDISALVKGMSAGYAKRAACANLPYYITTPAISALIDAGCFDTITIMVQREVARRICAKAGTSDYGAFSVFVQYHASPSIILSVPSGCFLPRPKVDSAVVRLDIRHTPPTEVADEALFFRTVKAAFGQRRKTLLNALSAGFAGELSKDDISAAIVRAGILPGARGETLDIPGFAALANELLRVCGE